MAINTGLDNLATNQRLIRNKLNYVLSTYLEEELEAYNTRHSLIGGNAIDYPRTINLNVNTMDLRFGTDQFPALSCIPAGSTVSQNIYFSSQDVIIDYEIIVAAVSDSADLNATVEKSSATAAIVADVVEKYLPEAPGRSGVSSVYKVDQVRTITGRPTSFGNGLFLLSSTAVVRVFSRAQMNWNPAYISSSYEAKAAVPSNFYFSGSADWRVNSAPFASAEASSMSAITMGVADSLDLRFSGSNIPSGSTSSYVIRRDLSYVEQGPQVFLNGDETITLSFTNPPQTDDVVNVIISISGSQNELNYPAKLTII